MSNLFLKCLKLENYAPQCTAEHELDGIYTWVIFYIISFFVIPLGILKDGVNVKSTVFIKSPPQLLWLIQKEFHILTT